MPASDNSTQRAQALALLKRRGMTRLAEFSEAGITATTVAMLLAIWFDEPHRAMHDVDLLGFGDAAEDALLGTFREIMAIEVDDGVIFDLKALKIEAIREEVEYGGPRLRTSAAFAGTWIPITVDFGFGDAVEPGIEDIDLPALLDMSSPNLRAYPPEAVIAEKFHAMVVLGRANSLMKDYFDVWMLTGACEIDPERLRRAIAVTFQRRNTAVPSTIPDGRSDAFAEDPGKLRQWEALRGTYQDRHPNSERWSLS